MAGARVFGAASALLVGVLAVGCVGGAQTTLPVPSQPAPAVPVASAVKARDRPAPRAVDATTARIERLARVWGEVRYRHPYLWEGRGIDWDAALVSALPRMEAAKSDEDERRVLETMLATLHDPLTRVVTADAAPMKMTGPEPTAASRSWDGKTTLVWQLGPRADLGDEKALRADVLAANTLVVDLRVAEGDGWDQSAALEKLADVLVSRDGAAPGMRGVLHLGYRPQRGWGGQSYFTGAREVSATNYRASKRTHPLRVIAVVSPWSSLPDVLLAMQQTGDAQIVSERELQDRAAPEVFTVPLPSGAAVDVRTNETTAPVRANLVVSSGALDAARKLAHTPAERKSLAPAPPLPPITWQPDLDYAAEAYPSRELRVLALVRFWNVIRLFYPALRLIEDEETWDDVFAEMLPRMQSARDLREYSLAVAMLASKVHDGHVFVDSDDLWAFFGHSIRGLVVRPIESRPIVTEVTPAQEAAGVRVGDEVLAVDGVPFAARIARVAPYMTASTESSLASVLDQLAMRGGEPEATLQVRGADGGTRDVRLVRAGSSPPPSLPVAPPYKLLESGTVGYVDLGKLAQKDVDPMFAAFEHTRAIVFDMRSYPRSTMWLIAPRLNVRHPRIANRFVGAAVGLGRSGESDSSSFEQHVAPTTKSIYRGRTVMLIDERSISQAEHTGLAFEAAAGTKFVGSPSAGADGAITETTLPGGITVVFSGMEVFHADGRQLQRVGLQPDVLVAPTIAGIRAGRDEVLERALQYVSTGR